MPKCSKLWGEATYRQGRVVKASVITRHGRRFDELHDGAAASKAMIIDPRADAQEFGESARKKLAVTDYAGGGRRFHFCHRLLRQRFMHYLGRADAKLALGDRKGAISDCLSAKGCGQRT